jgi:hypothetical protein
VPSSFSWECVTYARQAEVPFRINLYTDSVEEYMQDDDADDHVAGLSASVVPTRTIIEFQRMGGDGWAFLDVVRAARYFLESTDLVEGGVPVPDGTLKTLSEFKPASSVYAPMQDPKEVEEVVSNMLNMCKASYLDVQSEAAIALADLSARPDVQAALLTHPTGIPQLVRMLDPDRTPMASTYRCAAATLNNMMGSGAPNTQGTETARHIMGLALRDNWLSSVTKIVASCQIPQVLRECAALVGHIVTLLPADLKADLTSDLKALCETGGLNVLLEHPDETIQQHMLVVRQELSRV